MENMRDDKTKSKSRLKIIAIALAAIAIAAAAYFFCYRPLRQRVTLIEDVAAKVSGGDLKALGSGDGAVSGTLREAVGEGSRDQQWWWVRNALQKLDEATLGQAELLYEKPEISPIYRDKLTDLLVISGTRVAPEATIWTAKFEPLLKHRRAFLNDWFSPPQSGIDPQLEKIRQALTQTSKMEDGPFKSALHTKRIELWKAKIQNPGQSFSSRSDIIRSLLETVRREPDEQLRLSSTMFLGTQVIWSMLHSGEAEIIKTALEDLRPSLKGIEGLRFDVVLSTVEPCEDGDICKWTFLPRLSRTLTDLEALAKERRPRLEMVLREILQGLPAEKKKKAWEMMLEELDRSYIFRPEPDAWPEGFASLAARARKAMTGSPGETSSQILEGIFRRMVELPIYETEMLYLSRAIETRWAKIRLIENCHNARAELSKGSSLNINNFPIIYNDLRKTRLEPRFDWDVVPLSTEALAAEAEQIHGRLMAVRGPAPQLADELTASMLPHCRALAATKPAYEVSSGEACSDLR